MKRRAVAALVVLGALAPARLGPDHPDVPQGLGDRRPRRARHRARGDVPPGRRAPARRGHDGEGVDDERPAHVLGADRLDLPDALHEARAGRRIPPTGSSA